MDTRETMASTLRRLRKERELTQATLADRVGVTGPTIWSWETGKTRPKGSKITALAEVLQVAESDLIVKGSDSRKTLAHEIARSKARIATLAGCRPNQVAITINW